jgi:predicted alpha/beta-hydrolase family hydrolase
MNDDAYILSARGSGAPQPSTSAAKVEDFKSDVGSKLIEMNQVRLLEAQSRKTRAEAINTELQEPYNQALANVYGSVAGVPAVAGKALGGIATGVGTKRQENHQHSNVTYQQ